MWYEIYRHISPSGKSYIGITSEDSYTRWTNHCRRARFGSNTNFHKAIRKYGEYGDTWIHEVLDVFYSEDKKFAYSIEQLWITYFCPKYNMDKFGWNITDRRGMNNPMYGKVSGNANQCSVKGIIFESVSKAAEYFSVNRATISKWIKTQEDCFKLP